MANYPENFGEQICELETEVQPVSTTCIEKPGETTFYIGIGARYCSAPGEQSTSISWTAGVTPFVLSRVGYRGYDAISGPVVLRVNVWPDGLSGGSLMERLGV